LIVSDGIIEDLYASKDARAVDLGPVALIPGLVNAHTHLEFSDREEPLAAPGCDFFDWISEVVVYRRRRSVAGPEALFQTLQRGLRECAKAGGALVADIVTSEYDPGRFDTPHPRLVLFRELYTLRSEQVGTQLETARRFVHRPVPSEQPPVVFGLSPHAPYTVHPDLFEGLVELARRHQVPLAMHLAETQAELELLRCGTGPCVEMLRRFGLWKGDLFARGTTVRDYLNRLADLDHALVVHGNYLNDDDVAFLAEHPHVSVIYCPRTHEYFGHPPHRWKEMLERGVSVAIGTDSRASNPDLSVWNELKFLRQRHPDVSPRVLLELGTLGGARALGLDDQLGSLQRGKRAELAVVELDSNAGSDPYKQLFGPASRIGPGPTSKG